MNNLQLYSFKNSYQIRMILKQFYWTLISMTTPSQSGLGSNGREGVIHTLLRFRTGPAP